MFSLYRWRLYFVLLVQLLIVSCTSKKNLIYFQGSTGVQASGFSYNPVLAKDDVVSIMVMDLDADAVKPFNIPVTALSQNNGGYIQGSQPPPGYLVDSDGKVDFPVLGKITLAGLTRSMAIDTLKKLLKPYLAHPTVLIRILNFKVTVLGEVRNPGTFTIPNERITLPEALGIAGDVLITGVRKNILVIRDVNGIKTETRIDLTSKELFSSPVYYLNQNDLIYVEPNRAKINSSVVNVSNVSLVISIVSLLATMAVLFTR